MTYFVKWTNLDRVSSSGRKYSDDCFINAISKLQGKKLPLYGSDKFSFPNETAPVIGYASQPQYKDNTLSMLIEVFPPYEDIVTKGECCFAGSGTQSWVENEERGWHEVNSEDYNLSAVFMSKMSNYPVSISMEIVNSNE